MGYPVTGVVTGKPIGLGGSLGRNEADRARLLLYDPGQPGAPQHPAGECPRGGAGFRQRGLDRGHAIP